MASKKRITKYLNKLKECDHGDSEAAHCDADMILIELLKEIGYTEVAEEWERLQNTLPFWYA